MLICAGLDPTGRAGLLADVSTVTALGARAAAIATALTAQGAAFRSETVPPALLRLQLKGVLAAGPIHAVKLGMVPDLATLKLIRDFVAPLRVPVVIDPVVRTSKGEPLSTLRPRDFLRSGLRAVLTPNRDELDWFGMEPLALLRFFEGIVVKGGRSAADQLWPGGAILRGKTLSRTLQHRGTGCRFASALAVGLAQGKDLTSATRTARSTVRAYLRTSL